MNQLNIFRITAFILCVLGLPSASGGYHVAMPAAGTTASGLDRAGAMSRVGFRLARVFNEYKAHAANQANEAFMPRDRFLQYSKGRVQVDARAIDDGATLLHDLQQLGMRNGSRYGAAVSGLLPVAAVRQAAALDSLRSIHATPPPIRNSGSITSQGDVAMRADIARTAHDVDGTGTAVGVMSDSYNTLGGAAGDITSGDLPAAGVTVINGESSACGSLIYCIDEGRAMLQIVHDIAPGADLLFHTALQSTVDFANGIAALEAAGADVIVDDLLYLNEPMFEDGVVAQAVDAVVANGVAYYSAAGNQGRQGYESIFRDSGEYLCLEIFPPYDDCNELYERVGRMHDFDPGPGQKLFQSITIPYGATLTIAMQWDEPFGNAKTDHDVVLLDENGAAWYEFGANDNVATGEGWEVLQFTNDDLLGPGTTAFTVAITYDDIDSVNSPASLLKAVFFGNGITINDFPTNSSTLIGHANAAGAAAVGAAFFLETPEYGIDPPLLEPYSSAGGTPILFGAGGSPLPAPEVRRKPEFTAIDGVNTTFFFDDSHGHDGIDDFFGTSAAAPHAAGVAALMLQADPAATPAAINTALANTAIDMLAAGFDHDSGHGLIQADAAIAALTTPGNVSPTAGFSVAAINGLEARFSDTSTDTDGIISAWSWDFGGDGTSSSQNPTHTFSGAGTYTVTLVVTDDKDATDTISQDVTVGDGATNTAPTASFNYACNGRLCDFTDLSTDPDTGDGITAWMWDFGDGEISNGQNPSHTYASQGNYTVTLEVSDTGSTTGTVSASFRIKNRGKTSGTAVGTDGGGGDTTVTLEAERGRKKCSDGLDNDGDGLFDADDPDCN
jgi:PKD repeat protein